MGEGGMGFVFAARDRKLNRPVAIKVLRPEISALEHLEKTLIREAKAMARLSHPNVCTVYEVGTTDGCLFLAMEYIDGQTLDVWLKRGRSWQEILGVMIAAGNGLAAAHRADVIHRDLKLENIMIDSDGRVLVMDFGIATGADSVDATEDVVYDEPLTSFSRIIGTPPYMALELLCGNPANKKSDQFSFAVTAYEALYGVRPYFGRTFGELIRAYQQNDVHQPPRNVVPRWLRQVLLRGASTDANDRYDSVDDLVAELVRIPNKRRFHFRAALFGLVMMLGVVVSLVVYQRLATKTPCQGSEERFAQVWNEDARARLQRAMVDSGMSNAGEEWRRASSYLDAYGTQWVAMHRDACEATRVRDEQSDEMLDRRMLCLDARRTELEQLLTVLGSADRNVAQRAVQAVLALSDVDRCSARQALLRAPPEPQDQAVQAQLAALRGRLATAKALYEMGRYVEVKPDAAAIAKEAHTIGYAPVTAEARLLHGRVLASLVEIDNGSRVLESALLSAEASGDDLTKLEALGELLLLLGYEGGRYEQAEKWVEYADATLARVENAPGIEAEIWYGKAALVYRQGGDLKRAFAYQQRSLELSIDAYGKQHIRVALKLDALGSISLIMGKLDQAIDFHDRALAIVHDTLGEQHPVAATIINNRANAYFTFGRFDESREQYQRALEIVESFLGPNHTKVAISVSNLGNLEFAAEKFSKAIALYKRALSIEERLLGKDHPNSVVTMINLGMSYLVDFEPERAAPILERAFAIVGDARTEDAAMIRYNLGQAVYVNGDHERGLSLARSALQMFRDLGEPYAEQVADVQDWLSNPR